MQAITYLITQVTESVRATLDVEGPSRTALEYVSTFPL